MGDTTTAIEPVNLASAADKLKDQIRSAFAELLSPEQWREMVRVELVAFTKPHLIPNPNRYEGGTIERPSVLREMCESAFRERIKAEVKTELDKWTSETWSNDGLSPSDMVKEYFDKNAETLTRAAVSAMMLDGMQRVIQQLRSNM
jgi:hypothetical protein